MNKKKSRPKLQQIPLGALPQGARGLAVVFHRYYARLYWNNVVVRLATKDQLIMQMNGRVNVARLARLQKKAGCLVELQPIAPEYYHIMMWSDAPPSVAVDEAEAGVEALSDTSFIRYRPFPHHQPTQDEWDEQAIPCRFLQNPRKEEGGMS